VAILYQGRIRALDSVERLTAAGKKTVFSVTLADPAQSGEAMGVISSLEGMEVVARNERVLTMVLATTSAPEVIAALVKNGILIEEARIQKRSLEEIYLDVMREAEGREA
jgi:ABC-2 type transport system ATP-binding protein